MIKQRLVVMPKLFIRHIKLPLDQPVSIDTKRPSDQPIIPATTHALNSRSRRSRSRRKHVQRLFKLVQVVLIDQTTLRRCRIKQLCPPTKFRPHQPQPPSRLDIILNPGSETHSSPSSPIPSQSKNIPIITRMRPIPTFNHGDPWGQGGHVIPGLFFREMNESTDI